MTCWQVRPSSHFFKGRLRAKIDYSCNYEDKTFDDQSHFSWKKPLAHGLWCHNLWIRYPTENDHDFSMFQQTWMKENCASNFKANTENLHQPLCETINTPIWNSIYLTICGTRRWEIFDLLYNNKLVLSNEFWVSQQKLSIWWDW